MSTEQPGSPLFTPERKLRVLVVDDDEVDQISFRRAVNRDKLPYDVTPARSVAEAAERLAAQTFDVIVTDYSIGDGTAFDVTAQAPGVPWIIVTGAGAEAVAVAALRAGAQDYIVKSIDLSHLKLLPFSIDAAVRLTRARAVVRMLSHAMKSVLDAVYITDLDGNILFANAAFGRLYGHDPEALGGLELHLLEGEGPQAPSPAADDREAGWVGEVTHRTKSGATVPVWLSRSHVEDEHGLVSAVVYVSRDMTERRRLEDTLRRTNESLGAANQELERSHKALAELAVRDELTGLYNRRELNRLLDDETSRSARSGQPLSLILLDVDHFKRVNDEHGHLAGDDVLRGLGRLFGRALRRIDRAARFGGEELAVVLPDTATPGALEVAERLRQLIAITPFPAVAADGSEKTIFVTASFGVASLDDRVRAPDELVRRADEALYRAKSEGRNRTMSLDASIAPRTPSRQIAITRS